MLLFDNFKDVIAHAPYSALNYQTHQSLQHDECNG
jgi:hypothetical protein